MLRRTRATDVGSTPDRDDIDAERGRQVVRTIRRVELWTVFRLAGCVFGALWAVVLLALALLWWIAGNTGTTDNIESFLRDVGFKNFTFNGPELLLAAVLGGLVLVLAATLLTTVFAALVNLVSELTGGVRVTVIESPLDAADASRAWREPISVSPPLDAGANPPQATTAPVAGPSIAAATAVSTDATREVPHHELRVATGTANPQRVPAVIDGTASAERDSGDEPAPSWSERAAKLLRGSG